MKNNENENNSKELGFEEPRGAKPPQPDRGGLKNPPVNGIHKRKTNQI